MRWLCFGACVLLTGSASAQDTTYQGKTVKEWTAALKSRTTRGNMISPPKGSQALGRPIRLLWPPQRTMPPTLTMG